jgi:hypothetical protein
MRDGREILGLRSSTAEHVDVLVTSIDHARQGFCWLHDRVEQVA